jgi:ribA/ribD-fused uncharacterized protein
MTIDRFSGEYRFLSNFYPATVEMYGLSYPSVEHAYQAAKTLDPVERVTIRQAASAADAKRLGRIVTVRPDWLENRASFMLKLVERKFALPSLRDKLLATGSEELVEGNSWGDTYWGVCDGKGANTLGLILMLVRERLAAEERGEALPDAPGRASDWPDHVNVRRIP